MAHNLFSKVLSPILYWYMQSTLWPNCGLRLCSHNLRSPDCYWIQLWNHKFMEIHMCIRSQKKFLHSNPSQVRGWFRYLAVAWRKTDIAGMPHICIGSCVDNTMLIFGLDAHHLFEERVHDHRPNDQGPTGEENHKAQQPSCSRRARYPFSFLNIYNYEDCYHCECEQQNPNLIPGLRPLAQSHASFDKLRIPQPQAYQIDYPSRSKNANVYPTECPA